MANKICPSCGYPNTKRAKKCLSCGYDFETGSTPGGTLQGSSTSGQLSSPANAAIQKRPNDAPVRGDAFTGEVPVAEFGSRLWPSLVGMIAILLVVMGYPIYITVTTGNYSYLTGYLPYLLIYIVLIGISLGRRASSGRLFIYENGFRTKKGALDLSFDYSDIEGMNPITGSRGTQVLVIKLKDGRRMSFPNYRLRSKNMTLESWFSSKIPPAQTNDSSTGSSPQ